MLMSLLMIGSRLQHLGFRRHIPQATDELIYLRKHRKHSSH